MSIDAEVANQIYRMRELHEDFSKGNYQEINEYYSKDFQGYLYMPDEDQVELFNASQIKEGNQNAASHYEGKDIRFVYSGLTIIPQSDSQWRMIRWYEEKSAL
ncbi:hypothetical protein [Pontibacillus yanchengensis]|uniref:DUF4440 domain-containing protein n=1 Tax=Pontibacillus yanchengensis Y32 TaxID=1385514 RepID=A0A0A2TC67_9BACI|nr:hypothetical protein [Pontibacillus yanchengensis]KGP73387.1 hypothetical protein N782_05745 [Pontibacillus yanchengensis Y32]